MSVPRPNRSATPQRRPNRELECVAEACEKNRHTGFYCSMHNYRLRRFGSLDLPPGMTVPLRVPVDQRPTSCAVEGCIKPLSATGRICAMHQHRWKRTGTYEPGPKAHRPATERFWRHVHRGAEGECWGWTGKASARGGYPQFNSGRKTVLAHRFSYELHHGPIPPGMLVLHSCDNPPCTNPDHLRVGTQRDNIRDAITRGRHRGWTRGERLVKGKLAVPDVLKIRRLARTALTNIEIAARFNVSSSQVSLIVNGKAWGWVTG